MTDNLNRLNCNNYYVYDHHSEDHWYAQNGLRSLYQYAKLSDKSFRDICLSLLDSGEVTLLDTRYGTELTLTMI